VLGAVPAFGIDTLTLAVGLGAAGTADRRRLALVVAVFEGGMPLLGAVAGAALGRITAGYAVWGAAGLLAVLGGKELTEGWRELREDRDDDDDDDEGEGAARLRRGVGPWGLLAAGLAVSVDELGAGLAAGAAGWPLRILVPALALQAVLFTYLGLRVGATLRRIAGRYGEIAGGLALLGVAAGVALLHGR
jgi:putative Mn2+ efflux pump MntP